MPYERLRSGNLRDRIIIQWPTKTPDGGGGKTTTWGGDKPLRAEVSPTTGGESFRLGVERRTQFYRVRIRFRDTVTADCRILLKGAPLNIRSCEDPNRDREQLVIMAESGAADG